MKKPPLTEDRWDEIMKRLDETPNPRPEDFEELFDLVGGVNAKNDPMMSRAKEIDKIPYNEVLSELQNDIRTKAEGNEQFTIVPVLNVFTLAIREKFGISKGSQVEAHVPRIYYRRKIIVTLESPSEIEDMKEKLREAYIIDEDIGFTVKYRTQGGKYDPNISPVNEPIRLYCTMLGVRNDSQ